MKDLNAVSLLVMLFLLSASAGPARGDDGGLVGYWPLDEGTGNVAEDLSGRGNSGRILGEVNWEQMQRGAALRFNGKDTTVRVPDSPAWNIGPGELTICLWVKLDQDSTGNILEHAFDKAAGVWVLQAANPPYLSYYDDEPRGCDIRFKGFQKGKWQHIGFVWRRAKDGWIKSYVNGKLTKSQSTAVTGRQFGDLFFGSMRAGYGFFKGYMRDVAVFDRALSERQIKAIYNEGVRLSSPVVVSSLATEKVFYNPKEKCKALVRVRNVSAALQSVRLRLQLVSGLDDAREAYSTALEIRPRSSAFREVELDFPNEEYGCELRAIVERDGQTISRKSEFLSVSDNLWKVCLGGAELISQSAPLDEAQITAAVQKARQMYCNWFERFFWAPDDWGELTPPPGATWFSSQTRRKENTEKLKFMIDEAHKHGIQAITYGKCMAGGVPGWEMARRRPEWFVVGLYGRTIGRPADVWDMDHWHEADKHKEGDFRYAWTYRWVDLRRLDALDHGIDELIGSARQFGWDGVRFDSGGFRAHFLDGEFNGNDVVNTRNMKRLKERIWKVYPDYLLGYNTNNPASKDGREYPLSPDDPIAHEVREMLAGGGLWMGEALREWRNGSVPYRTWSKFARDEVRCIRTIKGYGGHFCFSYGIGSGEGKAASTYKFVIGTMIGAHQYGDTHVKAPGSEHWGRFLTRWSGLVWHHNLRELRRADELVHVESERPLWWKQFANELVVGPGRRLIIVNLLNPPLDDEIAKTKDKLPDPVSDCSVTLKIAGGQRLDKVFFISPGSPNRAERLKPVQTGAAARVKVPQFDVWAMVVYELAGEFAVPQPGGRFTEPFGPTERAELKRATPRPIKETPTFWGRPFGNLPPAPIPTVAVADDISRPTPHRDGPIKARDFGKATVRMPSGLKVGSRPGLDVLIVKGFYHHLYRVAEAVRLCAPDARIAECTTRDLPKDYSDIFKYDVIVLVDMGADSWTADGHKRFADFAEAGGKLVVLGGPFTLGQGFFKGTELERVLPVEVRPARDVYRLPEPLAIGPKRLEAFPGRPLLYFYHATSPRPDAKVLLWAGKLPVALERKAGRGKTIVFIGTMLGEAAAAGETPFWQWKGWPRALGKMIL